MTIERAKEIMGSENFIGPIELRQVFWIDRDCLNNAGDVPFTESELYSKRDNYILIYGAERLSNGKEMTIRNMQLYFGKDPEVKEPCFYNQDWYDKELFVDLPLKEGWLLIRKNVYEDSRAEMPGELEKKYVFPLAVVCTYSFFIAWSCLGKKLWYHDFVWCADVDHNGDRIYVGKYNDEDGINKNGFSIHRHLGLRTCYGCID